MQKQRSAGHERVLQESRPPVAPFEVPIISFLPQIPNINLPNRPPEALAKVSAVPPKSGPPSSALGTLVDLPDSRKGYEPQKAYVFSVAGSHGTVREELEALRGHDETVLLANGWGYRCNLNQELAATEVVLFLSSHDKPKYRYHCDLVVPTTQQEDLAATSHQFADNLATTVLSARIFHKSRSGEPLSEGEKELFGTLKLGFLRCLSGGVGIRAIGRLGVFGEGSLAGPYVRAVGQRIRSIDE